MNKDIQEDMQEALDTLTTHKDQIKDPRVKVLIGAIDCVTRNRNTSYGEPEDNFARIARFNDAWLQEKLKPQEGITPIDVAALAIGIKMGRLLEDPLNIDSCIDLAGYVACLYHVALKSQKPLLDSPKTQDKMLQRDIERLCTEQSMLLKHLEEVDEDLRDALENQDNLKLKESKESKS